MKTIFLAWVACFMVCVAWVKLTRVGGVAFVVNAERGWGVHYGDFLVIIPIILTIWVTVRLVKS
jgi:hypothetical protein